MNAVSVEEAKGRLSELVDQVEAGHVVNITRRGELVARLTPATSAYRSFPSTEKRTTRWRRRILLFAGLVSTVALWLYEWWIGGLALAGLLSFGLYHLLDRLDDVDISLTRDEGEWYW